MNEFPRLVSSQASVETLDLLVDRLNITTAEARIRNHLALEWAAGAGLTEKITWFLRRYGFDGTMSDASAIIKAALREEHVNLAVFFAKALNMELSVVATE